MGRHAPPTSPMLRPDESQGPSSSCPACGVALDGRAVPPNSVVLCATCCTPLFYNATFSVLTAEQLQALPDSGRRRLCALLALGRRGLGSSSVN